MQPLTLKKLAANAYRTLGISAAADQSAIENAARRMRIWPDPARIPPTRWDLPWLGALDRSRMAIEQSVSRLNEPVSRLEERLSWYHITQPPRGELFEIDQNLTSMDVAVSMGEQHAAAVTALHVAGAIDPAATDVSRWKNVFQRIQFVVKSADTIGWLTQVEEDGEFEKRASTAEITTAVEGLPAALAAGLIPRIQSALDRNDTKGATELIALFSDDGPIGELAITVRGLLDHLEDDINVQCNEADHALRNVLRTSRSPREFYAANFGFTSVAANTYKSSIGPALARLSAIAPNDAQRILRVRSICGQLHELIALGWSGRGSSSPRKNGYWPGWNYRRARRSNSRSARH